MIQINNFLSKLRNLLSRISSSSNSQIQLHSNSCYQMIIKLIKNDNLLNNFTISKYRLLSFEMILYVVQQLSNKNNEPDNSFSLSQKQLQKNKILSYLVQIKNTLTSIKQLINYYNYQKQIEKKGFKSPTKSSKNKRDYDVNFEGLNQNLSQYQFRVSSLIDKIDQNIYDKGMKNNSQNISQSKNQNQNDTSLNEINQNLIEQTYMMLQKKQKVIIELSNKIELLKKQRINIQIGHDKILNQKASQIKNLNQKLQEIQLINQNLSKDVSVYKQNEQNLRQLIAQLNCQLQNKIFQSNKLLNQPGNSNQINKLQQQPKFNQYSKFQNHTQTTISSLKYFHNQSHPLSSNSTQNIKSSKSFRRIGNINQKDHDLLDKKLKHLNQKNQQLYRILLCQAGTIQQLF